jgi:hypothetical protein
MAEKSRVNDVTVRLGADALDELELAVELAALGALELEALDELDEDEPHAETPTAPMTASAAAAVLLFNSCKSTSPLGAVA